MTIPIQDANIDFYLGHEQNPDLDAVPDITATSDDIQNVEISARTDEVMDEGSITLWNHDGKFTEGVSLQPGDRIEFHAPMGRQVPYGNGWYGGGLYGGTVPITWTGRVLTVDENHETYDRGTVTIEAAEFAGSVLSSRQITATYVGEDVGAIIRDIAQTKAPEVSVEDVPDLGVSTDIKYSARGCLDAVLNLAARADATVMPSGLSLHINPIDSLPFAMTVGPEDYFVPINVEVDDDIKNIVRINSGKNRKIENQQESVDTTNYRRVTQTDRLTHQLQARKSQIHSVDLFVSRAAYDEPSEGSQSEPGDELRVRLQSDDGGEPVAPGDSDSDITAASWGYDNLPDGDWRSFFFDEHNLADREPWLIIEADGDTGHDIGRSSSGALAYRSYYPHPLNFEVQAPDSVAAYGPREKRIERNTLKTLEATRSVAEAELAKRAWPSKTVEFDVASGAPHYLAPGDRININVPNNDLTGEFIVNDVTRTWDSENVVLQTTISAAWRKGILAPPD